MHRLRFAILASLTITILTSGTAVMVWLIQTKPAPPRRQSFQRVLEVAVAQVVARREGTPVIGHGTVRAKNQINIVPQVSGELTHVHPDLAQGKVIPKGALLFEIDRTVYEARVSESQAQVRLLEATLGRQAQQSSDLDQRIGNVAAMLAIDEKDYLTSKQLLGDGVGTQRGVDALHHSYLRQKDALAELQGRRSSIPHAKLETEAQLDAARSRLSLAQHDLGKTRIVCPFEARVETVGAYRSQVVTAHFSIATLTDMEAFEISVAIDPRDLRWLKAEVRPAGLQDGGAEDGPEVSVYWSLHGEEFVWRGHVSRFERVDESTRMARLVVEVRHADMTATVKVGGDEMRPALSIGMFCRAELPGASLSDALTVPRHAIHDQQWVYVFEPDDADPAAGRLARRRVPMLRSLGDRVLVDYEGRKGTAVCELAPGELVVVSPLRKPIVGMAIRLRSDESIIAADVTPDAPHMLKGPGVLAIAAPLSTLRTVALGDG